MKILFETFFKLIIGFIIASIGVVMTINSNLGLSPWDVLHQGLSKITPLSIGGACIVVGLTVVLFSMFLGVNLGIGTILNTILMGVFIDWISYFLYWNNNDDFRNVSTWYWNLSLYELWTWMWSKRWTYGCLNKNHKKTRKNDTSCDRTQCYDCWILFRRFCWYWYNHNSLRCWILHTDNFYNF